MALGKCKECKKKVSKKAKLCPNCGVKNPVAQSYIFALPLVLIIIISSFSGGNVDYSKETDGKYKEISFMNKGKGSVRDKLKDPDSAEFKNVFFSNKKIPMTCGEVNSKNSFGGYIGFQRFISAGKTDITYLEEELSSGFSDVWSQYCK